MTSVPSCVAQTLITTFANISANEMITEQTVSDVFKDDNKRYITRKFILTSDMRAQKMYVNLKMMEIPPDKMIMRLNLDFITDIYEDSDILYIKSNSCTVMLDIETEE